MKSSVPSCLEKLGNSKYVDREYLRANRNCIFVFGDNLERRGKGGAAVLRDEPNTYGFITKKKPLSTNSAFYTPDEYMSVYKEEVSKLRDECGRNPDMGYLISKVGAGLANRFGIFERIIEPNIKQDLATLPNVSFLW